MLKLEYILPLVGQDESLDKSLSACIVILEEFQEKLERMDYVSNKAEKKWKKQFK